MGVCQDFSGYYSDAIGVYENGSVFSGEISIGFNAKNLYNYCKRTIKDYPYSNPYTIIDEAIQTNVYHEMGHGIVEMINDYLQNTDELDALYDENQQLFDSVLDNEEDAVEEFAWGFYDGELEISRLYRVLEIYMRRYNIRENNKKMVLNEKQLKDIIQEAIDKTLGFRSVWVIYERDSDSTWYSTSRPFQYARGYFNECVRGLMKKHKAINRLTMEEIVKHYKRGTVEMWIADFGKFYPSGEYVIMLDRTHVKDAIKYGLLPPLDILPPGIGLGGESESVRWDITDNDTIDENKQKIDTKKHTIKLNEKELREIIKEELTSQAIYTFDDAVNKFRRGVGSLDDVIKNYRQELFSHDHLLSVQNNLTKELKNQEEVISRLIQQQLWLLKQQQEQTQQKNQQIVQQNNQQAQQQNAANNNQQGKVQTNRINEKQLRQIIRESLENYFGY